MASNDAIRLIQDTITANETRPADATWRNEDVTILLARIAGNLATENTEPE